MQARDYQKWLNILITLGAVFLLLWVKGTVTSAQVGLETALSPQPSLGSHIFEAEATPVVVAALPPVQGTAGTTVFLPILMRNPAVVAGCNPSKGSGGLAPGIHVTTVADLKAVVVVGDGYSPQQATYLAFYLHGDEGNYTQFKYASNKVTQFAKQHGWIFIAPQSPNNGDSWWANWQGDHNEALAKVFKEMFAQYNLCRGSVFGSTLSGGSVFWNRDFFPNKGGEYPSYTVLVCGGLLPGKANRPKVTELGQNPDIVKRSSFEYVYGTEDHLYSRIQEAMIFYKDAGFEVTKEELPGVGHCVPDFLPRIVAHWTDRAAKLGIN